MTKIIKGRALLLTVLLGMMVAGSVNVKAVTDSTESLTNRELVRSTLKMLLTSNMSEQMSEKTERGIRYRPVGNF